MNKPTALLADDHPNFLEKVKNLPERTLKVVGQVADGQAIVEAAEKLNPDIIITDISMPILDGIKAVKRLKESGSKSKVGFLTVHADPDFVRACFINGGSGYVVRSQMATDLVPAIRTALAEHIFTSPIFRFRTVHRLAVDHGGLSDAS